MKSVGKLTLGLILAFLLTACTVSPTTPVITQTPIVSHTRISGSTATLTLTPTASSPTIAAEPTLSPAKAETKLLELLRDNGGCRLPCFLGLTPGQTSRLEVVSFLHVFDSIASGTEMIFPRDDLSVSLSVTPDSFDAQSETVRWIEVDTMAYRKGKIKLENDYTSPYYLEIFQYYMLPSLLATYGPPDHVYVFLDTGIADMGLGIDLYLLHLDYPKQGWVAHLEMPLYNRGDLFVGCPSEAFTTLHLWSPDDPARDFPLDLAVLFTIEEATGMSIDEFYQKFKDPSNISCLETPANIRK